MTTQKTLGFSNKFSTGKKDEKKKAEQFTYSLSEKTARVQENTVCVGSDDVALVDRERDVTS